MNGLRHAFRGIRRALTIAQVPFAIGGSWASTTHGEPRQTNDVDLVAALNPRTLDVFLDSLGAEYYCDRDTAQEALRRARPFNIIHRQLAFKFDVFPIHDEHGSAELERTQSVIVAALDDEPVPIVSAEDIIIAKLGWYRDGGETSEQQWRDIVGVLRMDAGLIDDTYLDAWTRRLGLSDLCHSARQDAAQMP